MSGSRVLWGQVALVLLIVFVAIWSATEWTAWRLGFQAQLGVPWFLVAGWPFYYPPAFFWWWYFYDAYAPSIFVTGGYIASSGGLIGSVVAIALSILRAREARNVATYGSARWAEVGEVKEAGLLDPDGVVLGRWDRDYLRHNGPEHVLCFAPTRSGKGVGLVVPTLLTWPGSTIVHDIKGENWGLTAGFRAHHGRVLLFDPTDELLLVAGVAPVRAKKARYYEDARFMERVLPPPVIETKPPSALPSDDWSELETVASPGGPAPDGGTSADGDSANAGIRREPELPEHEDVAPPERPGVQEFDVLDDEPDVDAAKARAIRQQVRFVARQATMDPADGLDL
ncbi:conjugal transfer coupling protein TraG [Acetobacter senegalensis]|uniref:Conjugal transfer coupling protein TraG n=1 Tax=Acetobacter senegalensis TaxID=446692 RepID=A0A0U4Y3I2_9PROT|nr:type IV secretory system conjugative DNA transfer family protein [Acetobacter senegalensis]CEF41422.1 conjugal transfer coupling protein TraG [Acetobacter senegalensis]